MAKNNIVNSRRRFRRTKAMTKAITEEVTDERSVIASHNFVPMNDFLTFRPFLSEIELAGVRRQRTAKRLIRSVETPGGPTATLLKVRCLADQTPEAAAIGNLPWKAKHCWSIFAICLYSTP